MLFKQSKKITIDNKDILKEFNINLESDGLVSSSDFRDFIEKLDCVYNIEEQETLENFFAFFTAEDEEEKVDLLLYYYFLNEDQTIYSLYIWGISENGRLGLTSDKIQVCFLSNI